MPLLLAALTPCECTRPVAFWKLRFWCRCYSRSCQGTLAVTLPVSLGVVFGVNQYFGRLEKLRVR